MAPADHGEISPVGTHEFTVERQICGDNSRQYFDLYIPSASRPDGGFAAVLLIHGGAWYGGRPDYYDAVARDYASQGFAVANMEYRRDFVEPEESSLWIDQPEDVHRVVTLVRAMSNVDETRLLLHGTSAGGHLALLEANRHPAGVLGVIAVAPVSDGVHFAADHSGEVFWRFAGKRPDDPDAHARYERLSPIATLSERSPAQFLFTSRQDNIVDAQANTLDYAAAGTALGVDITTKTVANCGPDPSDVDDHYLVDSCLPDEAFAWAEALVERSEGVRRRA